MQQGAHMHTDPRAVRRAFPVALWLTVCTRQHTAASFWLQCFSQGGFCGLNISVTNLGSLRHICRLQAFINASDILCFIKESPVCCQRAWFDSSSCSIKVFSEGWKSKCGKGKKKTWHVSKQWVSRLCDRSSLSRLSHVAIIYSYFWQLTSLKSFKLKWNAFSQKRHFYVNSSSKSSSVWL